ncbi:Putative ribonuclease H protein At1g65750 [Linum perenne]
MGGLIRNDSWRFIHAFTANIGDCSITRSELSSIVQGLKLAWSLGIRKTLVQSDSRTAVSILQKAETNHQHVYREANCGADYLANLGHSYSFGVHLLSHPDISLTRWLRYDLVGVALPRAVLV